MPSINQMIKNIKLKKILTLLLASSLIIISTACSQGNVAQEGKKAIADTAQKVMTDTYDDYDANQKFEGGMNGYNDDRRYDAGTAVKTKALVDTVKTRQENNSAYDVGDITDRVGNKLEQAKRDIPRSLEQNSQEAANYIDDKSDNLKRNLGQVPGGIKNTFSEAVDTAQDAIQDGNQATKNAAEEIKDNIQDLT